MSRRQGRRPRRGDSPSATCTDICPIGDENDARLGTSGFHGEPGAVTQTRVGTTLLWTMESAAHKGDIDEDSVRDLATMLAKRSQQAQNGNEPSAALNG